MDKSRSFQETTSGLIAHEDIINVMVVNLTRKARKPNLKPSINRRIYIDNGFEITFQLVNSIILPGTQQSFVQSQHGESVTTRHHEEFG